MGYAVDGFCYPDISAAALYLASHTDYSGLIVQGAPMVSEPFVSLPVAFVSGGVLVPAPAPLVFALQVCEVPGRLDYLAFDPATLDPVQISAAFGAGFTGISIPILFAIGVSAILNTIRGKK